MHNNYQKTLKGLITKYKKQEQYGFIRGEDNNSYWFPAKNLKGMFVIEENSTEVQFVPSQNDKGRLAKFITPIKPVGRFSYIPFSTTENLFFNNKEHYHFLKQQKEKILKLLQTSALFNPNNNHDWISIELKPQSALKFTDHYYSLFKESVPSGYRNTSNYLMVLLEDKIKEFNHNLLRIQKGIDGETRTMNALRAVNLNNHVLQNVRFKLNDMSFESDFIVLTEKGICIIESKNWGGKNQCIKVSPDGRWALYTHTPWGKDRHILNFPNPYMQITNHELAMEKLLHDNNISVPVFSIIAMSSDNVGLDISQSPVSEPKVVHSDMVGRVILGYMRNSTKSIPAWELERIKNVILKANLPPNKYHAVDYYENIKKTHDALIELLGLWETDEAYHESHLIVDSLASYDSSTSYSKHAHKFRSIDEILAEPLSQLQRTRNLSTSCSTPQRASDLSASYSKVTSTKPSKSVPSPSPKPSKLDWDDLTFTAVTGVDDFVTGIFDGIQSVGDSIFSSFISWLD